MINTARSICSAVLMAFIILLLSPVTAPAQQQYNVDYITTENGLPSDGIKGLQWDDHDGFLWIATELGLVRYNGNNALMFDKNDNHLLKSDRIFPLVKNLSGNIYAVNSSRIFRVYPNKLDPIPFYPIKKPETAGMLWLYLAQPPADRSSININDYYDQFRPIDSNECIVQTHDTLWMYHSGTTKKDLLAPLWQLIPSFISGRNLLIYDEHQQFSIYDSIHHSFVKVPLSEDTSADSFPPGKKKMYWEPGMKYPILLAGSNAWLIKYKDGKITPTLICSEVPINSSVKYVQYWEQGAILFLGTGSKGVIIIRKNYLDNVKRAQTGFDESNAIYSQILLSNGDILANTGDILGHSTAPVKQMPVTGPFHNNIYITADSTLWYTINDSLYHYDYKTNTRSYTANIHGSLYLGFAMSRNNLYVTNNAGIYLIKDNELKEIAHYKNKIGDPYDMAELQPGVMAIASAKGLFRYDIDKDKFDTILQRQSPVRALWKYKDYLFIGTYGDGIYIWKNGVIRKIPLDNNNYLLYTHCFILDPNGYCWMSTNRGLLKASLEDMLDAYEHNGQFIYYHFFGKNEGMDITEMNGGCTPCGIKRQDQTISFPTMDGALWVDPFIPVRFPNGNIVIDRVTVNGVKVDSDATNDMLFHAGIHDISFSIGFPAWCDKENVYLEYSLSPHAEQWQKMDPQHAVIHLSNLASGRYELSIRELKGFGHNNFSIKKITFEIQAPWYLSWWGEILLILLFAGVVVLISVLSNRRSLRQQRRLKSRLDQKTKEILSQNEKLEKNDLIKTRLISIISHDIITPLKYLHLTSKYLSERKTSLPEKLRNETLEEVVNTSRELELLSTNILNWIKYQNEERRIVKEEINLHDLVEQVFIILKSLAHKNDIELVNNIPADTTVIQFVDPIRIILYNLTVNAINFTMKGSITISCKYINDNIQIEVKDTGLGMPKSQINNIISDHVIISSANVNKRSGHGLGYLIIKDLLKMIDGEFYIESKVDVGTSVYIAFPTK